MRAQNAPIMESAISIDHFVNQQLAISHRAPWPKISGSLSLLWAGWVSPIGTVANNQRSATGIRRSRAGCRDLLCQDRARVPHALHMPSHIFTRLGMWQQSIDSNRDAHAAALDYVQKSLGPGAMTRKPCTRWTIWNTLICRPRRMVRPKRSSTSFWVPPERGSNLAGAYAVAAIPVRFALERRDWPAAAALSEPAIGFPLERFPWAEAMIVYARALGSARTGNIAGAEAALEDKLKGNDTYWGNQVEVQRLAAAGILAHVKGDDQKAIALVRAAADLDATMDKHPATPSSVLPARELLADLLLELNQPAAALVEYRTMLGTDPNRFRSLLGEARAAKQTGDSATAQRLPEACGDEQTVGPARPELAEARSYLTN